MFRYSNPVLLIMLSDSYVVKRYFKDVIGIIVDKV